MSNSGGHTYTCGHVKYCGDHVQMVNENHPCWDCLTKSFEIREATSDDLRYIEEHADEFVHPSLEDDDE